MAKENLLREMLGWKLKMAGDILECLPPPIREQARQNLHKLVLACHEAAEDFLEREKKEETGSGVTPISID